MPPWFQTPPPADDPRIVALVRKCTPGFVPVIDSQGYFFFWAKPCFEEWAELHPVERQQVAVYARLN
jgi:hypothetical protein